MLAAVVLAFAFSSTSARAAAPETPETTPATAISGTQATLNGLLNPHSLATTGYEFAYNSDGTCTGGASTERGAEATGEAIPVATPLTGLVPDTQYTFCLLATQLQGETTDVATGAALTFKTLAVAPSVSSESSSAVTPFAAHLEALVNPNNQVTACEFQYGLTTAYGVSSPCEPPTVEGFGEQSVTSDLAGLQPATTYHYRVALENASGEKTEAPDEELSTLAAEAPAVSLQPVKELASTGVTLEAQVNPNYQETACHFRYGASPTLAGATTVPCEPEEVFAAGSEVRAVTAHLLSLQPGQIYYYRVLASNLTGPTLSSIEHVQTLASPSVTTAPAEAVTRTSAAIAATVNPAGAPTNYELVYIDEAAYRAAVAAGAPDPYNGGRSSQSAFAGESYAVQTTGSIAVEELAPATTYHYALIATNAVGTAISLDRTFTTLAATPPSVSTGAASGVTQLAATILGTVDSHGLPTLAQFEFGTTPYSGVLQTATSTSVGTVLTLSHSFERILQPDTTYYYRAVATNPDGTSYGAEQSFTTAAFPAPFAVPASPTFTQYTPAAQLEALVRPLSAPKPQLTTKQELARALKACKRKHKRERARCKRRALKRHAPKK
jgi:hypothetical protein